MLKKTLLTILTATSVLTGNAFGQSNCSGNSEGSSEKSENVKMMKFEKGGVTIINELGSIVVKDHEGLVVKMAGPKDSRPQKYRNVDLRDSDRIIMLNGSRITTVQEFEEGYKALEIGNDVELGIKRDMIMMIVSFPKASPDDLPRMKAMVISQDGGGISSVETVGQHAGLETLPADGSKSLKPVIDAGLIVAEKDDNVIVKMILPNVEELMKDNPLEEGDVIISLQGTKISSSKQFSDLFKSISEGSIVKMEYSRAGETGLISFEKKKITENLELKIER